jgi:hypothetical protein
MSALDSRRTRNRVRGSYLSRDATSIIRGISSENPALDFVRCIAYVWSAYEVIGETIINKGAITPEMKDTMPILTDFRMADRRKIMYEYSRVYNASMDDRNIQN